MTNIQIIKLYKIFLDIIETTNYETAEEKWLRYQERVKLVASLIIVSNTSAFHL